MKVSDLIVRRPHSEFDGGKLNVPVCKYCIILDFEESRYIILENIQQP